MNTATRVGLAALDDGTGSRADFARMRTARRARLIEAMAHDGLDALVLGREGNARYASGARRLFTSGTRPFGPGCIVVRATEQVHLLSTWDDGIPADIPRANLFGITWNPANLVGWLGSIPGLAGAARIGVDAMTPGFCGMIAAIAPGATVVDATAALDRARRTKTPDELACIRVAIAVAESALTAAIDRVRPGVTERELLAAFTERMATLGVSTPAMEGTFTAVGSGGKLRRLNTDRAVNAGALVVAHSGVLYAGYEGTVGRTIDVDSRARCDRADAAVAELIARCRPGALLPSEQAHGVGLGYEPLLGPLAAGMVVAVEAVVEGCLRQDVVAVTDGEPVVLTR